MKANTIKRLDRITVYKWSKDCWLGPYAAYFVWVKVRRPKWSGWSVSPDR